MFSLNSFETPLVYKHFAKFPLETLTYRQTHTHGASVPKHCLLFLKESQNFIWDIVLSHSFSLGALWPGRLEEQEGEDGAQGQTWAPTSVINHSLISTLGPHRVPRCWHPPASGWFGCYCGFLSCIGDSIDADAPRRMWERTKHTAVPKLLPSAWCCHFLYEVHICYKPPSVWGFSVVC